jgi:hypothetical protein
VAKRLIFQDAQRQFQDARIILQDARRQFQDARIIFKTRIVNVMEVSWRLGINVPAIGRGKGYGLSTDAFQMVGHMLRIVDGVSDADRVEIARTLGMPSTQHGADSASCMCLCAFV